jgi:hypothetical protein
VNLQLQKSKWEPIFSDNFQASNPKVLDAIPKPSNSKVPFSPFHIQATVSKNIHFAVKR